SFYDLNPFQLIAWLAVRLRIALADFVQRIHAADDLSEDSVLAVEVRRRAVGDEELRAVGILARIRHREHARLIVLQSQSAGFIIELIARAASAGALGIAALDHEALDD